MPSSSDAVVRRALEDLRTAGSGSHIHLDEILPGGGPPQGDRAWIGVAQACADIAFDVPGRFTLRVPLGLSHELPRHFELDAVRQVDPLEPPAIYFASDVVGTRSWRGEYYRMDLPESSERMLVYVDAARTVEEHAAGEEFSVCVHFLIHR